MRTPRGAIVLVTAAVALLSLAGCTSNPVAAPVAPAVTATPTPTLATPTTPPPTQVAADATPVHKKCSKLVPKAVVASYDTGFALEQDWTPEAGSPAARLAALDGTTCRWSNPSGDLLEVAVAKPSVADSTALKNDLVERSQSVPTYGGEAYFQVVEHVGQADVFRGRTWLLVRSNRFFEPGDASMVVASALKALGYGATATPTPATTPTLTPSPAPTPAG